MSDTWYRDPVELPPYVDPGTGRRWTADGSSLDGPPPADGLEAAILADLRDSYGAMFVAAAEQPAAAQPWTLDELNAWAAAHPAPERFLMQTGPGALWWISGNVAMEVPGVVALVVGDPLGRLSGIDVVPLDDPDVLSYWAWRVIVAPDKDDDPDAPPVVRASGEITPPTWSP